jgi:hypothetical protein
MDVIIKIILTIVAIIIATFLIGLFKAISGDNEPAPNVFIGILLIISITTIWSQKTKKLKSKEFKDLNKSKPQIINTPSESTLADGFDQADQRKNLLELLNAKILTDEEYEEKLSYIENKEQELLKKQNEESIKKVEELQKDNLIKKLEELQKDGIINQSEYVKKKLLIVSGSEKIDPVIVPPKLIERIFLKNSYTLKMGRHKVFKLRFDNSKSIDVYQKSSNNKYFIYGYLGIHVFPDLESLVNHIINKMMD